MGVAGVNRRNDGVALVERLDVFLSLRILPDVDPGGVVAEVAQLGVQSLAVGAAGAPVNDDTAVLHNLAGLLLAGLLTFEHSSSVCWMRRTDRVNHAGEPGPGALILTV